MTENNTITPDQAVATAAQLAGEPVRILGILLAAEPGPDDGDRMLFLSSAPRDAQRSDRDVVWIAYPNAWDLVKSHLYFTECGPGFGIRHPCLIEGVLHKESGGAVFVKNLRLLAAWKDEMTCGDLARYKWAKTAYVVLIRDGLETYERGGGLFKG